MLKRRFSLPALIAVGAIALTACSSPSATTTDSAPSGDKTTLTFRLWDKTVAEAYEESFAEFEKENPSISVDVTVVPWADYWTKLRTDVAAKKADDLFWVNNSYFTTYADSNNLVDVDHALGEEAKAAWQTSVVDQYTRDDVLWAVPQLYDAGIATYYNKAILDDAGVSPKDLNDLVWSPDDKKDTFLPVARKLTKDAAGVRAGEEGFDGGNLAQFGTNIAYDLQAILLPYIGSSGGSFQKGDQFSFAGTESAVAFDYLVKAINSEHVAPPADDTNSDGDFSLKQFTEGRMGLFQSGLYNLKNVSDDAGFEWGVAPIATGPKGRVTVTNGVAVAGNAQSEKQAQITKVLTWLGSEKGNAYLGKTGSAVPAVTAAQPTFTAYWKDQDVDVSPFFEVAEKTTPIAPPGGVDYAAGLEAFDPLFKEIFAGKLEVAAGLKRAEDAANVALVG